MKKLIFSIFSPLFLGVGILFGQALDNSVTPGQTTSPGGGSPGPGQMVIPSGGGGGSGQMTNSGGSPGGGPGGDDNGGGGGDQGGDDGGDPNQGPPPSHGDEGDSESCGNGNGPSEPPECPGGGPGDRNCDDEEEGDSSSGGDSSDQNCEGSTGGNALLAYNGNAQHRIVDLEVAGSPNVGDFQFARYSATRLSNRNLLTSAFGAESSWSHSFEYNLRRMGNSAYVLTYPNGKELTYQVSADPNVYLPVLTHLSDRLEVNGNELVLDFGLKGGSLVFSSRRSRLLKRFYRLEEIKDSRDNSITLSYQDAQDHLVREITDASGNWFKLHYNDLQFTRQSVAELGRTTITETNGGDWHTITVPRRYASREFRYLSFFQGNSWRNRSSMPIAEIEFYDENDQLITTGVPFGSEPLWDATTTPAQAFDGDESTHYRYLYDKAAHVGIELATPTKVSRMRFKCGAGIVNRPRVSFFGHDADIDVENPVLSHVESSDGRAVGYSYDIFSDESSLFQWARLIAVDYPDGATAQYTYTQIHPYLMPSLASLDDPRFENSLQQVAYDYSKNAVIGFVRKERNAATGAVVAEVQWGRTGHRPKLAFSNGSIRAMNYSNSGSGVNGRLEQVIDSYGFITEYEHDENGFVVAKVDELNRRTTYTRDDRGRVMSMTTPYGSVTEYVRDEDNRVLEETVNGKTTKHTRNPDGTIARTDHPDGTFEIFRYNELKQRTFHRQRNGHVEFWGYNDGLLKSHIAADGATTRWYHFGDRNVDAAYQVNPGIGGLFRRLAAREDEYGNVTRYYYNDRGQVTRRIYLPGEVIADAQDPTGLQITAEHMLYDDYGNLISRIDENGDFWQYEYNSLRQKIREEDPLGRVTTWDFGDDAISGASCSGCSLENKPLSMTYPDGTVTLYTYDKEWRLLTETEAAGTPEEAVTTYEYDGAGQRTAMIDPLGHRTEWSYDLDGRINRIIRAAGTPLATTQLYLYDLDGNRLEMIDPIGTITKNAYDIMNRMVLSTAAYGTAIAATTSYHYNATTGELDGITDPLNRTTTFTYDNVGRRLRSTLADGNYTETTYDLLGRRIAERDLLGNTSTTLYDHRGWARATTDAAGVTMTYDYDDVGRVTSMTYPSGKSVAYGYDSVGNRTTITQAPGTVEEIVTTQRYDNRNRVEETIDGEGQSSTYIYDRLNRLLSTTDANGNTTSYTYDQDGQLLTITAADHIVDSTRTYDALHRLTSNTDGKGQTMSYFYDPADRFTSYQNGEGHTFSFGYDALGRRTSRTEADATRQSYTYDLLGRLTTHTQADGSVKTFHYETPERDFLTRISFSNDEPDYLISGYNAAGQPLVVANEDATITYDYDSAGRRILERQELLGLSGSHDFTYSYNQDGQLAGHIRPDGSLIDYNYNDRQLLSALTVDGPPPVAEYFYNGRNQLTVIQLEEGLTSQQRVHDRGGRLVSIVQEVNGRPLDGSLYNLDRVGQRTGIFRLNKLGGTSESYGYDTARQVVSAFYGSGSPEGWTYDAAGNRISDFSNNTATDYTVNAVNQYTAIQGAGPNAIRQHDLKGNLLDNGEGSVYTWDINNRLQTVVHERGSSASYGYDAFGRRVWKREQINGTTEATWFLTNGWNVELEHDGSNYVRRYSWGQDLSGSLQGAGGVGGLVMIEHLNGSAAPETYYPCYDGNGNVTALIDNGGEVVATYRYNTYGGLIGWTGAIEKSRYRFSTKPVEEVSGLYYYGYRYYDPKTGRWPSRDPIEERGGVNLHHMVFNNPLNFTDVLGRSPMINSIFEEIAQQLLGEMVDPMGGKDEEALRDANRLVKTYTEIMEDVLPDPPAPRPNPISTKINCSYECDLVGYSRDKGCEFGNCIVTRIIVWRGRADKRDCPKLDMVRNSPHSCNPDNPNSFEVVVEGKPKCTCCGKKADRNVSRTF